jgi:hypothetical protein
MLERVIIRTHFVNISVMRFHQKGAGKGELIAGADRFAGAACGMPSAPCFTRCPTLALYLK